jgi:DUF4097 and DUF4098 domain-containing protein YvlB
MKNSIKTKLNLVFIAFLLLFIVSSYSCIESDTKDEDLKVLHDKTFPISPGREFKLSASSGNIFISGWDKNEVHVKIWGNDKAKDKVKFYFSESPNMIEVEAKYSWSLFMRNRGIQMKFEIQVPAEFDVDATTSGGDIDLKNIKGEIESQTSGGDVTMKDLNGKVDISTSGGTISFYNTYGDLDFSTSGGDINGNQFSGKIYASTSGGNINMTGSDAEIEASTSGGNVYLDYSGQNKGIDLRTSGGNLTVKLPSDFNASADMSTTGGHIDSDFTGNNAVKISASKFKADINSGGKPLTLETSGGNIEVKKK